MNGSAVSQQNAPAEGRAQILEVEGLRGIALTMVVVFHLFGQGRVSGGVDVFLFISGFLLTGSLLRWAVPHWAVPHGTVPHGAVAGRPARLGARYGRTLQRLVPSAVVVLLFVAVATVLTAPRSTWVQTGHELVASALYLENWELIRSQLAYGAAGPGTSPLQHFWSLSIQGQFFLLWPLVVTALVLLARRLGVSVVVAVGVVTVVLTVASFGYAGWLNGVSHEHAYFDSFTRFWELGAGALLAIGVRRMPSLSAGWRQTLGWAGLALILVSGLVTDGARTFPGPWALVPVGGAALVLLSTGAPTRFGADRLLAVAPVRFLARISYPLYLWHWPILIVYLTVRDNSAVGLRGAVVVFALSVAAAWLTQRWIAEPVLRRRERLTPRRALLTPVAVTTALVLGVGAATITYEQSRAVAVVDLPSREHPGALALVPGAPAEVPFGVEPYPAFADAPTDHPRVMRIDGCLQRNVRSLDHSEALVCRPGPVSTTGPRVVLAGGSHDFQWYDAIETIAERNGWDVTVIGKYGCRLAWDNSKVPDDCRLWGDAAVQTILDLAPDVVITTSTRTRSGSPVESIVGAALPAWVKLADAGIDLVGIRDTPRFDWRVPECLERHGSDSTECGQERSSLFAERSPVLDAAGVPGGMVQLDLTDRICAADRCEPVVGNVVVYRDDNHLTASYVRTLAPVLEEELAAALPALFEAD